MTTLRIVAATLAVSLLAACSGSDDATETTSPAEISTETTPPPTTEDPPIGTTASDTTDAPPTETPAPETTEAPPVETSAPETTEARPTTTSEDDVDDDVIAAIAFFEEQWKECLRTLPNCDTQAVVTRRVREEVSGTQANAIRWNQNDYRASNIDALEYRVDEVAVDVQAGTAVATVCVTDPVVLTEAGGTVVDDEYYTSIKTWDLTLIDDVWNSELRTNVGETAVGEENDLCAQ